MSCGVCGVEYVMWGGVCGVGWGGGTNGMFLHLDSCTSGPLPPNVGGAPPDHFLVYANTQRG